MYVGYSESGGEYWSAPTGLRVAAAAACRITTASSVIHLSSPLSELLDREATVGRRLRRGIAQVHTYTYLLALNSLHTLTYMGEYESAYRFCSSSFLSSSSSA